MENNENKKNEAVNAETKGIAAVAEPEKVQKIDAVVEVEPGMDSEMREERMALKSGAYAEAEARENDDSNPIRKGEVLISTECEGNLSAFKKALKEGLVIKPEGLEAVSFHCAGFAHRDEGLVAKQFAVTLKVKGKWQPLSRYIASSRGGHFAMGASQTLKGAKTLAEMLKAAWLHGLDLKKVRINKK